MKYTIKSLNDQMIQAENDGIVYFEDIDIKSDSNTKFEFDDSKPTLITFIFEDANGKMFPKIIDLSKFGLDYNYVLNKIKPLFEGKLEARNQQLESLTNVDNVFKKAIEHVQKTYCDAHLNYPYMLLGDVAELIKITTGKEVDCDTLAKFSR